MIQTISMFNLSERKSTLAGAIPGKNLLAKMIPIVEGGAEPMPLFLDFAHIDVATGSFLRETVLGLRDYCKGAQLNLYPVIVNANDEILEELKLPLKLRGEAITACNLDGFGKTSAPRLVGTLGEKEQSTFQAVLELKEVDAVTLAHNYARVENIGTTGWNNRLASLVAKGILIERKKGRGKVYSPVMEMY
jgi:hypothetical protein